LFWVGGCVDKAVRPGIKNKDIADVLTSVPENGFVSIGSWILPGRSSLHALFADGFHPPDYTPRSDGDPSPMAGELDWQVQVFFLAPINSKSHIFSLLMPLTPRVRDAPDASIDRTDQVVARQRMQNSIMILRQWDVHKVEVSGIVKQPQDVFIRNPWTVLWKLIKK